MPISDKHVRAASMQERDGEVKNSSINAWTTNKLGVVHKVQYIHQATCRPMENVISATRGHYSCCTCKTWGPCSGWVGALPSWGGWWYCRGTV